MGVHQLLAWAAGGLLCESKSDYPIIPITLGPWFDFNLDINYRNPAVRYNCATLQVPVETMNGLIEVFYQPLHHIGKQQEPRQPCQGRT